MDPVHFDFKNWHDIGTGVLECEAEWSILKFTLTS